GASKGFMRARPAEPTVLARAAALRTAARETSVALNVLAMSSKTAPPLQGRLRVVLKDMIANPRTPPYDVFLTFESGSARAAGAKAERLGGLDFFGEGAGHSAHAGHGSAGGTTIAFEASEAMTRLSRARGFDYRRLRVGVVRRSYPIPGGSDFVPD